MGMFNLEKVKRESELSPAELARLERTVREEFAGDEMLFELHLVRAIRAIKAGQINIEEALSEDVKV